MNSAQILLFADLPPACHVREEKRKACVKGFLTLTGEQLSFDLITIEVQVEQFDDEQDDPLIAAPMVQRTVSAKDAAPMVIKGPCSVWAMAFTPLEAKRTAPPAKRALTKVERIDGLVRCVRIIESETQEYKEKEVARRARQTPPKPSQAFKRMSSKLQALVS